MRLELLEIDEADQLSACKLALLLGVFTQDNRLESFLKFTRGMINAKHAILAFHNEPYVWYSSSNCFKAFLAKDEADLISYFNDETVIDPQHPNYHAFSQHIDDLGVGHQRVIAFNLKRNNLESVGQVILFDDEDVPFNYENLELVHEFVLSILNILELRVDYADLKEQYEQQLALNSSKTKFFQILAHDLRAPFHGLIGFSDVLANERDTLDDENVQDISTYLQDTLQSTYGLLENLLNWAMAEGGRFVYHPINFKLKQTTQIVYEVLNSLSMKKNIELIDDVSADLMVYADINMVTSIIQNLVSNALKFTHTDGSGKVVIKAEKVRDKVEISIHDTGLGMTKTQMDKIFEPQIKVSLKGTTGEKGTGLGLVLCKRFVDLNHGEISVSSKKGQGSIFTVTLPIATHPHLSLVQVKPDKNKVNHQI